ncbi:hypothetical protein B0H11DRAFT_1959991 [Mycena galericulata]|nr:hypothetical protein B0H11DRAFT_2098554 [Mycena galericulata]KAJ7509523.1 hypothetical protein B0H11DRAFT_1959991 [Mycena galericulata]
MVRLTRSRPGCPRFTEAGWKCILEGNYVDLDQVSQDLYGRKVTNSDLWHQIWNDYAKCIKFVFTSRGPELDTYADYIEGLFISTSPDLAHNVINCDRAIRIFIGNARQHLFDDISVFSQFERSHLIPGMAQYQGRAGDVSGGSGRKRNRTGQSEKTLQICRNWNRNKCPDDGSCKRIHVCSECHGHHRKSERKECASK